MSEAPTNQNQTKTEATHTLEPWGVWPDNCFHICGPTGVLIGRFVSFSLDSSDAENAANARRAIACVNACVGINPLAVPALLAACKEVATAYDGTDRLFNAIGLAESAVALAEGDAG